MPGWGVAGEDRAVPRLRAVSGKRVAATGKAVNGRRPGLAVEFKKSGKAGKWAGRTTNLPELAEANGISIPSGCRAGSCGTCQVAVFSGEVGYLDKSDFETEPGTRLTCIGCPKSDVVIDA